MAASANANTLQAATLPRARQSGDTVNADAEHQKALAVSPDAPGALLGITTAHFMEAKFDDALSTAQTALSRNPDDPKINLPIAEVLVERRRYSESEAHLKQIAGPDPEITPRVHALLGRCYSGTNQVAEAIKDLEAGKSSDNDRNLHYQLSRLYQKNGKGTAAAAALKESQDLHRDRLQRAAIGMQEAGLPLGGGRKGLNDESRQAARTREDLRGRLCCFYRSVSLQLGEGK